MQHVGIGENNISALSGVPSVTESRVTVTCHRPHRQHQLPRIAVIVAYDSLKDSQLVLGQGLQSKGR